ncbi:polyhydroxyalkanoate depolymerase [Novosphingobium pentaromativorans]|uniref:Poly(3-hydroxybutyrate) depolymerase n=1 Tax=Novosphingobium pentaromativorans US6-1 TaxID=1088721 RepID=G6E7A4_9SPHN|nr:polyhydroxyalkanoate depolymerase [Novosphingobium pentaromativorans]AIT81688.1 poly(3-hydroxybutyrate) depolymerase [Novosphingobium pentaromativorans US6-1]EHJ62727.1 poly(3-hydroxybutyrate) depolymerase [Novosphingobium pentaromativorans US6-1]
MLYHAYQAYCDMLAPARMGSLLATSFRNKFLGHASSAPMTRRFFALAEVFNTTAITHKRPPYGIGRVLSGNREVSVREEVTLDMPFGNLLHFAKDEVVAPQPKILVVAPLSGHFATLLRSTIATLLRDHDVYITDWKNARDIPMSDGRFGFDEYVDYVIRFLQELGQGAHVLAVCQPCVPVLAAVAVMAQNDDPCQPRSMSLMGGPIDTRESPTIVNELATSQPYSWFEDNLIYPVPWRYKGAGRKVYPGFVQLTAFMSMNQERHFGQFRKLYQHIADLEQLEAEKIVEFYDEYLAVLDLTAEFYLETIDKVFQRALLAKGELEHRGRRVDCSAIRKTALLTVEGERDDICAVGQTAAAHFLCSSLRPHLKRHHLQPGVGHYGIFSGSRWERQVYPQVRNLVLAMS